jgi:hypothetical protein
MNITLTLSDELIKTVIRGIMENFPEASATLRCTGWKYNSLEFTFMDDGDDERTEAFHLDETKLRAAFPLMFTDKWPKGCTPVPRSDVLDTWEEWLCQADATDFDAFVQLACFGEVIYG